MHSSQLTRYTTPDFSSFFSESFATMSWLRSVFCRFVRDLDAALRQHASCALQDSVDVEYRVSLLRRVAVCSWVLGVPSDVPSDEVIAITIRTTHFLQMCLLGPFGAHYATMRIVPVKKGSKTTHCVSCGTVALKCNILSVVVAFR